MATSLRAVRREPAWAWRSRRALWKRTREKSGSNRPRMDTARRWCLRYRSATTKNPFCLWRSCMTERPRILVVDDEPQLTRVLRTGLKSHGYDVRAAADGLAGFETFNDWHPDLVITDLAMPNVDGLELCRRLRAVSQVPIIEIGRAHV